MNLVILAGYLVAVAVLWVAIIVVGIAVVKFLSG